LISQIKSILALSKDDKDKLNRMGNEVLSKYFTPVNEENLKVFL